LVLELVDTLVGWLAIGGALWHWALATSTADTDTVDNIALLGLVTQTACLIRTRWAGSTVDDVQLSKLPASNTEKEAENIGLLLLLQFLDILKGSHLD